MQEAVTQARAAGRLTQKEVIERLYNHALKVLRGQENESVDRLLSAYRLAQDQIVAQIYSRYGGTEGWTLLEWEQSGRLGELLAMVDDTLQRLAAAASDEIGAGAQVQFVNSYDRTAYALDQATPADRPIAYSRAPEDAVKILTNTPYKGAMFSQRIGLITNAMASDIRDELTQSLIQGESMEQAAKRVTGVIGISDVESPKSYANRGRVIARTEIMRAQNMARSFLYEQNKDVVDEEVWMVTPDDRLCPWCLRREGLTDTEIRDSDPGDDPWGNDTEAPLHPHCRCVKAPKLKTWKELIGLDMPEQLTDDTRGMRDDKGDWVIAPVETFDAWKAAKTDDFAFELGAE